MALTEILVLKTVTSDTVLVRAMLYSLSTTVPVCHKSVFEYRSVNNHRSILHILSTYLLRGYELSTPDPFQKGIRDLKQTTLATEARTWKNKRSNWQNNSSARAF